MFGVLLNVPFWEGLSHLLMTVPIWLGFVLWKPKVKCMSCLTNSTRWPWISTMHKLKFSKVIMGANTWVPNWKKYLTANCGIVHQTTCPYTFQKKPSSPWDSSGFCIGKSCTTHVLGRSSFHCTLFTSRVPLTTLNFRTPLQALMNHVQAPATTNPSICVWLYWVCSSQST